MVDAGDWRAELLAQVRLRPVPPLLRNPIGWPGYTPRAALRWGDGLLAGHPAVAVVFDFTVYAGTVGEADAAAFAHACAYAAHARLPLVSFVRTGGTRLQEGMAALVGIPRLLLGLDQLAAAGVAHVCVVDQPTTGGVWVALGSRADLRLAVEGATVGFTGPRVAAAMTGTPLPPQSHTAAGALAAGLVDALTPPAGVAGWLRGALAALAPHRALAVDPAPAPADPGRDGAQQYEHARSAPRPDGAALLDALLDGAVRLRGPDERVLAVLGRSAAGRRTVGVALAAQRSGFPGPAGFALLRRAAQTAGRLSADLLTLVDTPGADPSAPSEAGGVAAAIGDAAVAMLRCPTPTLAVVHGEGGSGGALAAAVADEVLVGPDAYFAALGPVGAAAALRVPVAEAAERMRIRPGDLARLGFATPVDTAPGALRVTVAARLAALAARPPADRLAARRRRWAGPLPGGW